MTIFSFVYCKSLLANQSKTLIVTIKVAVYSFETFCASKARLDSIGEQALLTWGRGWENL